MRICQGKFLFSWRLLNIEIKTEIKKMIFEVEGE